ncbi:hypothetical protein [Paraburkholderia sp. GAS348]|uniref:hypothetical protein n=1 Tax=Paraburkholderia sp. GAS348 TaxID=3035132 RepID=UPI003D19D3DD
MSTISPSVRIEGSISQPRLRASDPFLPPFGNEWALLPPEGNLRAELGALLRTFCLHDETIWSMCHWASPWPESPSAPMAVPPPLNDAMPLGASVLPDASAMRMTPDVARVPGSSAHHVVVRAACAIGAAAVLIWVAFDDLPQRHAKPYATSAQLPDVAKHTPAQAHPRDVGFPTSGQTLAPATLQPHRVEARPAHRVMRDEIHVMRFEAHHPDSRTVSSARRSGRAVLSTASPKLAPAAITHRSLARPSAAGRYSSFAPVTLGIDEYAAVTLPTDAPLHDAALVQPAVHRGNFGDTEWMSHLPQRRITEVPGEFSK